MDTKKVQLRDRLAAQHSTISHQPNNGEMPWSGFPKSCKSVSPNETFASRNAV